MKKVRVKKRRVSLDKIADHICSAGREYLREVWKRKYGDAKTAYVSAEEILKYIGSYRRWRKKVDGFYYTGFVIDLQMVTDGIGSRGGWISRRIGQAIDSGTRPDIIKEIFIEEFNKGAKDVSV